MTLARLIVLIVPLSSAATVQAQNPAHEALPAGRPDRHVWARAMEVTQATQTWLAVAYHNQDELIREITASDEMVPLVQGKRTVARVYPGIGVGTAVITGAEATLTCQGADLAPCPGPAAIRPASPLRIDPRDHNGLDTLRRDATRTWNFVLPEAWTTATDAISLTVTLVESSNAPECPSCADGANYLTLGGLVFHPTAPLELHILYACVRRNASDPPSVCDHAPLDMHEKLFQQDDSLVVQTFPVAAQDFHLTLHDPITVPVDGDFSQPDGSMTPTRIAAFEHFVCELANSTAGGAPPPVNVIYVGILPAPVIDHFGLGGRNCIVAGPNYARDATSTWNIVETVAHELGHALGRPHAGCGIHGEPAPCDPTVQVFPCLFGGICTYGFDTAALQVIDPGDPPDDAHAHDLMSYGPGRRWISPYTYRHLYDTLREALLPTQTRVTVPMPVPGRSAVLPAATVPLAETPLPTPTLPLMVVVAALSVMAIATSIVAIAVTARR
jgi:hypothetical protein